MEENYKKGAKGSIKDYFFFGKKLGEGASAIVRPARKLSTGKVYAIKTYNKLKLADKEKNIVSREAKILKKIDHENIIKLYEMHENRRNIHLVMEFGGKIDLKARLDKLPKLDQNESKFILRQIAEALNHIHSLNIAHNDVKLENIVLTKSSKKNFVKLVDFGFARENCDKMITMICGTPNYMSPELLMREKHDAKKSDVWAFGVLAFYFLGGKKFPFKVKNEIELLEQVKECDIDYSGLGDPEAVEMLQRVFVVEPGKRAGFEELLRMKYFLG